MNLKLKLIPLLMCLLAFASSLSAPSADAKSKSDKKTEAASDTKAKEVKDASKKPEEKAALIDINSASKEELMKIPGVGTRYSDEIIKGRPYKAKNQLVSRKIVPDAVYKSISDKIIAKQK